MFQMAETQDLLDSDDILKHKIVHIAAFLARKYSIKDEKKDKCTSHFSGEYSRGGLITPTFGTVPFVHCAHRLQSLMQSHKMCGKNLEKLLAHIDVAVAKNTTS